MLPFSHGGSRGKGWTMLRRSDKSYIRLQLFYHRFPSHQITLTTYSEAESKRYRKSLNHAESMNTFNVLSFNLEPLAKSHIPYGGLISGKPKPLKHNFLCLSQGHQSCLIRDVHRLFVFVIPWPSTYRLAYFRMKRNMNRLIVKVNCWWRGDVFVRSRPL